MRFPMLSSSPYTFGLKASPPVSVLPSSKDRTLFSGHATLITVSQDATYSPSPNFKNAVKKGLNQLPERALKKLNDKGYQVFLTTNIPKSFPELAKKVASTDIPSSRYKHSLGFVYRDKKKLVVSEYYKPMLPALIDWFIPDSFRFKNQNPAHTIQHEAAHALVDSLGLNTDYAAREAFVQDTQRLAKYPIPFLGRAASNLEECLAETMVALWRQKRAGTKPSDSPTPFPHVQFYLTQRMKKLI